MLTACAAVYRAWPLRPHCGPGRHVLLCRWLRMPRLGLCGDSTRPPMP